METGARSYGIWNCLHVCTSHQWSKKVRKPNRQIFFFKTGEFAPRENWHQLVGCSGGPNAAQILQVTSLHLHGAWSKILGRLELPTWVH
jgi:hypothetical protein